MMIVNMILIESIVLMLDRMSVGLCTYIIIGIRFNFIFGHRYMLLCYNGHFNWNLVVLIIIYSPLLRPSLSEGHLDDLCVGLLVPDNVGNFKCNVIWLKVVGEFFDFYIIVVRFFDIDNVFHDLLFDVWHFDNDRVGNLHGGLVGHLNLDLHRNLLGDRVGHLVGNNDRDLSDHFIWYLDGNLEGNLNFDFIRNLLFDNIRFFGNNFERYPYVDFIMFFHVVGIGDFVGHLLGDGEWYLHFVLVGFLHIVGVSVDSFVSRGISGVVSSFDLGIIMIVTLVTVSFWLGLYSISRVI